MFTKLFLSLITIYLYFDAVNCQAQFVRNELSVSLSHYTDENGLPQNSVNGIAADNDGFIWIATENGLVRFDGQQFYVFNKSNSSMANTRFYNIQRDLTGKKSIIRATGEDGTIMKIEKGFAVSDSAFTAKVYNRLPHFKEKYFTRYLASGSPGSFVDGFGTDDLNYIILVYTQPGSFYIVNRDNVAFYALWKKKWTLKTSITEYKNYFGHRGQLYRILPDGIIQKYSPTGTSDMTITGALAADPAYVKDKSTAKLFWNNVSDQSFLLVDEKLYYLELNGTDSWTSRLILQGFEFVENNIAAIHYDVKNERTFLGSVTRGLFVATKKSFLTLKISKKDEDNNLYGHMAYDRNHVLTPSGIILGHPTEGKINTRVLPALQTASATLTEGRVILRDRKGNFWVKSYGNLCKFDATGTKILRKWNIPEVFNTMYEGSDGRIWIIRNAGIFYSLPFDPDHQLHQFKAPGVKSVYYVLQQNNTLWMATHQGLYAVGLKTGGVKLIPRTEKLIIRSIYISPSVPGGIFLMTYEDGVFLYMHGKLTHFPLDDNKYLSAAHCMVEDQKGFLWIPTNKGLFQFAKADLLRYADLPAQKRASAVKPFYLYYDRDNGFATNEFNGGCQPCSVTLQDGTVSLPSLNGFVWFQPDKLTAETPAGNFIVDRVESTGKSVAISNDSVSLGLTPKQISFNVEMAFFGNPSSRQLEYAFTESYKKPADSDWLHLPSNDPTIRFSSLSSGNYTLTIRKVNGFGANNYLIKTISVVIPRHWYETIWFRVMCALLFVGLLYLIVRFRTGYLQRENEKLEDRISSRTQNLQEVLQAMRDSEQHLTQQIHIQDRLVASISHDVRTPMKYHTSGLQRIALLIRNGKTEEACEMAKSIGVSAEQMTDHLENIIAYTRAHSFGEQVKFRKIFLHELIDEKAKIFAPVIEDQFNQLLNQVDADIFVHSNPQLLGIVLHNLLDNANKYTSNGLITIYTKKHQQMLHLIVSNTGAEFPTSLMNWLNASFSVHNEPKKLVNLQEYKGLGLLIVKEIAQMLNLTLLVENVNGARIHLIFNTKEKAYQDVSD